MEWCNPVIVDLSVDTKESKKCVDGGAPTADCVFGGVKHGHTCNGGNHAPLCDTGGGGAL